MLEKSLAGTYCLLGLPVNILALRQTLGHIYTSVAARDTCFLSTPNINFFATSLIDSAFLDSLIASDINVVDGAPLVFLGRCLNIPIPERVAGASVLEMLVGDVEQPEQIKPLKIFFFGGDADSGAKACSSVNAKAAANNGVCHVTCTGYLNPGVGTVDDLSQQDIIREINDASADFLVVSLGAAKGQAWILRNLKQLNTPVVSHLGAAINFISGEIPRAPVWGQRFGCEWLWRIKEQPKLFTRYWYDGLLLFRVVIMRLVPYWFWLRRNRSLANEPLSFEAKLLSSVYNVRLTGALSVTSVSQLDPVLSHLKGFSGVIKLDMSYVCYADARGLGWLLDVEKLAVSSGASVVISQCNRQLLSVLRWNHLSRLVADPTADF